MKRKCILIFMIVLAIGMTACSSESKEDAVSVETDSPQETDKKETTDTKDEEAKANLVEPSKPEIEEEDGKVSPEDGEITEGDPIAGIVEKYEGNKITIRTPEDDFIETTAGKGCYVSVQNQDFYLEEQQKKIEGCFNDAIEIARMSGIPLDKLISLLTLLYEED